MKHYGDITKINGAEAPVVDIITGGSPCQDLSVAGKRAGLAGERSGLFMEQMRIVKEMRERERATGRTGWMVRPRYMVWENVPGAFSSGNPKGADFAAVIEEIIKVAEPGASVSVCVPNGGWTKSGCYYAEDGSWSLAWRVHDAQFWGVPQRRKRIALVADFGGLSAPEILFERKGLSRDSEQSGEAGQETARTAGGGVTVASWGIDHVITTGGNCTAQGPCVYEEVEATLKAAGPHAVFSAISFQERAGKPGGGKSLLIQPERTGALSTLNNQSVLATVYGIDQQGGKGGANFQENVCPPILSDSHGTPHAVAYGISAYESNAMKSGNPHSGIYEADTARTLDLNGGSPACNQGGIAVVQPSYCLQGNGIGRSDNAGCNGKGWTEEVSYTLNTIDRPAVVQSVGCDVYNQEITGDVAASLTAASGGSNTSGPKVIARQESAVYDFRGNGDGKTVCTITGDHQNRVTDYTALCIGNGVLPFDTTQITSPQNGCNPHYGDPCHPLAAGAHPPAVAIRGEQQPVVAFTQNQRNEVRDLGDVAGALAAEPGVHQQTYVYENHSQDSRFRPLGDICQTVSATYGMGGNNQPLVVSDAVCVGNGQLNQMSMAEQANTLKANLTINNAIVRRLTPLECERLQGYPDGWTDIGEWADSNGKKHGEADSPRYKALGNSIALPFWQWMARRICAQYERPVTMASLFDGIGGFPLVFQRCGAVPVWASEIEEFPIAVTKVRFPDESV